MVAGIRSYPEVASAVRKGRVENVNPDKVKKKQMITRQKAQGKLLARCPDQPVLTAGAGKPGHREMLEKKGPFHL